MVILKYFPRPASSSWNSLDFRSWGPSVWNDMDKQLVAEFVNSIACTITEWFCLFDESKIIGKLLTWLSAACVEPRTIRLITEVCFVPYTQTYVSMLIVHARILIWMLYEYFWRHTNAHRIMSSFLVTQSRITKLPNILISIV